jgi:AmmeMemoRadiSam system protein B
MPSPLPERPGFLIRDPLRFSDTIAVLPRQLARCLPLFDGDHTEQDLCLALARMTGELAVSDLADDLVGSLREAGFLEDEAFAELRSAKEARFAESPLRLAAHAGGAYPGGANELAREIDGHLAAGRADALSAAQAEGLLGVAAPHVALEGGGACYGAAYASVPDRAADATFIVLGTSHYGLPNRFGLTAKPFVTPFGQTTADGESVAALARAAPSAVTLEDYCHAVEHSIEFQILFLQRRFGTDLRVLPILCGPRAEDGAADRPAAPGAGIAAFAEALGAVARRGAAFWVLGIDLAHIGQRYGDTLPATAEEGRLLGVGAADRGRLARVMDGDERGFLDAVGGDEDRLRWCGAPALQLFLQAAGPLRGRTLRYEQWNIDAGSVVSFAALAFWRAEDRR